MKVFHMMLEPRGDGETVIHVLECDARVRFGNLKLKSYRGAETIFRGTFAEAFAEDDRGYRLANAVAERALARLENGITIGFDGWPVKACKPRPFERDRLKQVSRLAHHAHRTARKMESRARDNKLVHELLACLWWR